MKQAPSSKFVRSVIKSGSKGDDLSGFRSWTDDQGRRCQAFKLPYPVSANNLHQPGRGGRGVILTPEARAFFSDVKLLLACSNRETMSGRIRAEITTHEADCRRRDINNCTKALFDALEMSHVYLNDAQIDETMIIRGDLSEESAPWVEVLLIEIDTRTQDQFDEDRRAKKANALDSEVAQGVASLLSQAVTLTG